MLQRSGRSGVGFRVRRLSAQRLRCVTLRFYCPFLPLFTNRKLIGMCVYIINCLSARRRFGEDIKCSDRRSGGVDVRPRGVRNRRGWADAFNSKYTHISGDVQLLVQHQGLAAAEAWIV
jgi:hypothetical protein